MVENIYTTEQVAKLLQIHPLTVLKYIKEGKIKAIKLGRVYRFRESALQEFLEKGEKWTSLRQPAQKKKTKKPGTLPK